MTTTTGRRLTAYSRQFTNVLQEARALAEVAVAERDTDTYWARVAAFHVLKARRLTGPAKHRPDRDR